VGRLAERGRPVSALPDIWSGFLLVMALGLGRPGCRFGGWRPFATGASAGGVIGGLLTGRWDEVAICAAALAVLAWNRWNRKGRRAARAIGARSAAALAAVVEKAREAGTPLPEGAGA
jgi:hypothetical protein